MRNSENGDFYSKLMQETFEMNLEESSNLGPSRLEFFLYRNEYSFYKMLPIEGGLFLRLELESNSYDIPTNWELFYDLKTAWEEGHCSYHLITKDNDPHYFLDLFKNDIISSDSILFLTFGGCFYFVSASTEEADIIIKHLLLNS